MNLFGRKPQREALEATFGQKLVDQQVAPGTQLHYDGELIGRLRAHHDALFDLSVKARDAALASRFDETRKCVNKFRLLLNEHLLEKNLRVYTYLGCCLKSDSEGLEVTRDMRRETGAVSRKATLFITHYSDTGINEENQSAFLEELAQVKGELNETFAREERTLYPMYQPPHVYVDSAVKWLTAGSSPRPRGASAEAGLMLPTESANADDALGYFANAHAESTVDFPGYSVPLRAAG